MFVEDVRLLHVADVSGSGNDLERLRLLVEGIIAAAAATSGAAGVH